MTKGFTVDDGFDVFGFVSLKEANIKADELKKANPLRSVYISSVVDTPNGEVMEVVAEA